MGQHHIEFVHVPSQPRRRVVRVAKDGWRHCVQCNTVTESSIKGARREGWCPLLCDEAPWSAMGPLRVFFSAGLVRLLWEASGGSLTRWAPLVAKGPHGGQLVASGTRGDKRTLP